MFVCVGGCEFLRVCARVKTFVDREQEICMDLVYLES